MISARKTNLEARVLESPSRTEASNTTFNRNENLMQLSYTLEISLPGVVSWRAEQDDTELVKASQQGDQDAFTFLVQKHQRSVFNMVLRMLQDYEEASEITQKAFFCRMAGAAIVPWRGTLCYLALSHRLQLRLETT